MRLRSNNVLRPVDAYVPRRRRTKSPSTQPEDTENASANAPAHATESAMENVQETHSTPGPATESAAQSEEAPKRKPTKKTGRKKAAGKGKKKKSDTTDNLDADAQPNAQGDALTVIPSVEQPDTRRLTHDSLNPRKPRHPPKRHDRCPSKILKYGSAAELLREREFPEPPQPTPSPPQTPILLYAWPPLSPGKVYDKLPRIPWSLPWTPPSGWRGWPRKFEFPKPADETVLISSEDPTSRKRNRVSEDEFSSAKRHKLVLLTPPRMGSRSRGSPRRTYADRARRREAERNGRIDRTIYRVPQFLAQRGEDERSGTSTPSAPHATEETIARTHNIVPSSALPSALPPTQNQPGWGRRIFDSVTRLWHRGNVLQTGDVTASQTQSAAQDEPHITTPLSAPPSSGAVSRNLESPTPRSRIGEPQTSQRKRYTYDLDPRGFDPELLARMRARSSKPAERPVPAPQEQVHAQDENESKKRKRQPSPDVIPHPPGCSYGFDPDYFIYDDDEEEEERAADERPHQDPVDKVVTISDGLEEKQDRVSKRVRTSKVRPENFNHQGHFQTPGWSSSSSDDSPQSDPQPSVASVASPFKPKPAPPTPQHDSGPLRLARQMAELYKPKTPSRLRAAHRYSSSPCYSYEENLRRETALRRRRIGPYPRTFAKVCPTGDPRDIVWPEPEPWISRLNFEEDLEIYTDKMAQLNDFENITNGTHKFFMEKLAEKRAARAAKKRAGKSAKLAKKCTAAH